MLPKSFYTEPKKIHGNFNLERRFSKGTFDQKLF